jgi:hypothetical protein
MVWTTTYHLDMSYGPVIKAWAHVVKAVRQFVADQRAHRPVIHRGVKLRAEDQRPGTPFLLNGGQLLPSNSLNYIIAYAFSV